MEEKKLTVWDVLNEYGDIRDELEDTLTSFTFMKEELESAMEDIADELEAIERHLKMCDQVFRRYKVKKGESFFTNKN